MLSICKSAICFWALVGPTAVWGQATIDDFAWLAGHWTGEGFGGKMEEYWAPPSDGVMIGMFKHSTEGKITFYEFFAIVEDEGNWLLKLKHFSPDFVGWEAQDGHVTFPLVSITSTEAAFDGLVMRKISDSQMEVILNITRKGKMDTERFLYTRMP